jgi:hypothetical protein
LVLGPAQVNVAEPAGGGGGGGGDEPLIELPPGPQAASVNAKTTAIITPDNLVDIMVTPYRKGVV